MAMFLGKNDLGQVDKQQVESKQTVINQVDPEHKADLDKAAKVIKMQLARKSITGW